MRKPKNNKVEKVPWTMNFNPTENEIAIKKLETDYTKENPIKVKVKVRFKN